jgi:hypothetical protein
MQQPYPPLPQKPLPHQRFWRWFRQRSKRAQIIACVVLVLSCSLCGYISATSANTSVVPTTATPTATQDIAVITTKIDATATQDAQNYQATATADPTDTPTQVPTATPTPSPQPTTKPTTSTGNLTATFGTPLLGGPVSDFIGKYGPPNSHTDTNSFHWFRDSSSNADGLIVWSLTHPKQVDSIDVQAVNGDMPDMSAANALCTVYNPDDAHEIKRIPLVNASGQDAGFDVVYVSASLARKFTAADDFTDANGNNVQPGSFDIQYLYKSDGTHIDSCSIIPGQQQTHL